MARRSPTSEAPPKPATGLPVHGGGPPAPKRPASDAPGLTLAIQGMHCASCVNTIEKALSAVPGVEEASVNLATARAEVRGRNLDRPRLIEAVRGSGYDAKPADETAPSDLDAAAARETRNVLLRTLA